MTIPEESDSSSALEAVARQCGIVDAFTDARGETRTISAGTRRTLIGAMGFDAEDELKASQALAGLRRQDAERCLPCVHVHYASAGPLELEVNVPVGASADWQIEFESGELRCGALQTEAGRTHLRIADDLPLGYHTLTLQDQVARCSLIVTPGQCWLPDGVETGRKLWGVAAQLYLLRSQDNWGVGDYADLKFLVQALADRGADVVGLNPLHAMFPDDPEQASPYSPASRLLLNILNIDVASLAASIHCEAASTRMSSESFRQSLAQCRAASLVDYAQVTRLKLSALKLLFECCDRSSTQWRSFGEFRARAGAAFEQGCLFLALRDHFANESSDSADWHRWPEEYRRVDSVETRQFSQDHAEAVTFQAWLQYAADTQLRECGEAGQAMAVGLYRDLAVGAALGGAETWANPSAVIDSVHVGAPPDIYNPQGQDWGLPPFDPRVLREEGYRSFIDLLRANMRHAGGIRIDHVMALQQLYWVPSGDPPSQGAYVRYPLEDMVGILALESHRHRCLVVGEDLGTVPEGFRERMERARILSYRVLFFEKRNDAFIESARYPRLALAVAGSHDLPTLRAWWQGSDLTLKASLGLYPTQQHANQATQERESDRDAIEELLRKQKFVPDADIDVETFVEAAHLFLASTESAITVLQLDDLTGEVEPANVPGTSHEHPNWRRRLSLSIEHLMTDSKFLSATAALGIERRPR